MKILAKTLVYIALHLHGLFVNRILLGLTLMESRGLAALLKTLFTHVKTYDLLYA